MIRANLKAGGSLVSAGSDVTISPSTSMVFAIPTDSEYVLVSVTDADSYGSVFTALIDLSDTSNPICSYHTGAFGAISAITYSAGSLTVTVATAANAGHVTATPLKVS